MSGDVGCLFGDCVFVQKSVLLEIFHSKRDNSLSQWTMQKNTKKKHPTKNVVPRSLKVGHWLSEIFHRLCIRVFDGKTPPLRALLHAGSCVARWWDHNESHHCDRTMPCGSEWLHVRPLHLHTMFFLRKFHRWSWKELSEMKLLLEGKRKIRKQTIKRNLS